MTKSLTSTASPTAKMSGSLVRMCSSTRIPPSSPMSIPALSASVVSGRTPNARITRSAWYDLPDWVDTTSDVVLASRESRDAVTDDDVHAVELEEVGDESPVLLVERAEHLIGHLDHGDVEPAMHEVLGHLQADEPAADHHCAHRRPHRLESRVLLHPGEEARAPFDPLADLSRVGHGAHREDARKVDARQRRANRRRARRQHELVVGLGGDFAGRDVAQLHGLVLRRDPDRLATGAAVDAKCRAEHFAGSRRGGPTRVRSRCRRGTAGRSSRTRRTGRVPP